MTRLELKNYLKQKLGEPVNTVEIDDSQYEQIIDEALQLYTEGHYDGTDTAYLEVAITTATLSYTLPDNVQSVTDILNPRTLYVADEPLMLRPLFMGYGYGGFGGMSFVDLEVVRQLYKTAESQYTVDILYDYNYTSRTLTLHTLPKETGVYWMKCLVSNPDLEKMYNNLWFKKYCLALCKYQWGWNLSKYTGGVLPGGASLNGDMLMNEGKAEKDALELELRERYEEPIDFLMG